MRKPLIQHSLDIFCKFGQRVPPLVPTEIKTGLKRAYETMLADFDLSLDDLEKTMIEFGKKIWPYRKAFGDFFRVYENKLGERFLIGVLPADVKRKYLEFKECGGDFYDLRSGQPANFFSQDERVALGGALVGINEDIHKYTTQAVLAADRADYEKRVAEFKIIFSDIAKSLAELKSLADACPDYFDLAKEINQQILSFEYGMCLLGPPHHHLDILRAPEYYRGRREEKKYSFV